MSREVLSPPLQSMGANRCYRVNLIDESFENQQLQQNSKKKEPTTTSMAELKESQQKSYVEEDLYKSDDDADEESDETCTITELPSGFYKLSMHVASSFYGGLIGFRGNTKRRIESETQTEIFVPKNREGTRNKKEDVTIKGKARSNVCAARRKILLLTASLRKRMRPTHFVGVPLINGNIQENFKLFKQKVLESYPGIDELLFQIDIRLHITLNVCVLLDDEERAKAVKLLESFREILSNLQTPFVVKVNGLEIMNDDPSAVRILYAKIDAPDLQKFANAIKPILERSGFAKDEFNRECVKLHMTLMNNKFRKKENEKAPNHFDAREILKKFDNFNFGTAECNEIRLCIMGSETDKRSEYKITGSLKF